jgi:DNA replication ATP-dependent helicase Dna2
VGRRYRDAVDTVERFQGQQRDVTIASYTVGDPEAIRDEEEFLMSLNRFNVTVSRARAKAIIFLPLEIVNHLPLDLEVLRESRLIKVSAEGVLRKEAKTRSWLSQRRATRIVKGELRVR